MTDGDGPDRERFAQIVDSEAPAWGLAADCFPDCSAMKGSPKESFKRLCSRLATRISNRAFLPRVVGTGALPYGPWQVCTVGKRVLGSFDGVFGRLCWCLCCVLCVVWWRLLRCRNVGCGSHRHRGGRGSRMVVVVPVCSPCNFFCFRCGLLYFGQSFRAPVFVRR